jgi:hypothetical protein
MGSKLIEKSEINGEKFARRATPGAFGACGTSDHHAIISSRRCSPLLAALDHARLLARSGAAAFGRAGASSASASFLSM